MYSHQIKKLRAKKGFELQKRELVVQWEYLNEMYLIVDPHFPVSPKSEMYREARTRVEEKLLEVCMPLENKKAGA